MTAGIRCSFLIKRVMPERLTTKPSPFKVFNIPAIDCKADTTWKTFQDTNMARTDKG